MSVGSATMVGNVRRGPGTTYDILGVLLAGPLAAQDQRTVTVAGEGQVTAVPDIAMVRVGVTTSPSRTSCGASGTRPVATTSAPTGGSTPSTTTSHSRTSSRSSTSSRRPGSTPTDHPAGVLAGHLGDLGGHVGADLRPVERPEHDFGAGRDLAGGLLCRTGIGHRVLLASSGPAGRPLQTGRVNENRRPKPPSCGLYSAGRPGRRDRPSSRAARPVASSP